MTSLDAVDEWWQERRRLGEEGYIDQIRQSRKHMQRGLIRSQKPLSSPIDFFSRTYILDKKKKKKL